MEETRRKNLTVRNMMMFGGVSACREKVGVRSSVWVSGGTLLQCRGFCFGMPCRNKCILRRSVADESGRDRWCRRVRDRCCFCSWVGIVLVVVMCDGVMQRRCSGSRIARSPGIFWSLRLLPRSCQLTFACLLKILYASVDHASFHTSAHSVQRTP
jgi:hypothetical protein